MPQQGLENPARLRLDWRNSLRQADGAIQDKIVQMRNLEFEVRQKHWTVLGLAGPAYNDSSLIVLGVCAMEKKARCKPMREILARLPADEFSIVIFDQKMILEDSVATWPIVDVLIAFYSDGLPLEKVEGYCSMRQPMLINDVTSQRILWDRVEVYKTCEKHGIPIPKYHVVYRHRKGVPDDQVVEGDDWIEINGVRLMKPFVEKPVDADNHDVCIYYPRSTGGGCKELFRKVDDRSSTYKPDVDHVRRDGSYIYEQFYPTDGSDVKVYAVTEEYAHAEARKSPAMDGIVKRDASGAEVRYPVFLKNSEKDIARRISIAFKQRVCGFDLLRTASKQSLVCDVNGWSFVKRNPQYTKDCAALLANCMRQLMGRPPKFIEEARIDSPVSRPPSNPGQVHEELRAVIAIFRHGDRTPKQKLKFCIEEPAFIDLYARHGGTPDNKEIKLKSAAQLADVLGVLEQATSSERLDHWTPDFVIVLEQARAVLEVGGKIRGINRKVQVRATKVSAQGVPQEVQFVFKWGGILTDLGRSTAEQIGRSFRERLYPGTDGLLRLHATYRHDLKIFSSDEGRVQVSAAAFVKGLLDLEGALTPILESLVTKDNGLLHDNSKATKYTNEAKEKIKALLDGTRSIPVDTPSSPRDRIPESVRRALGQAGNLQQSMRELHKNISSLVVQLRALVRSTAKPVTRGSESAVVQHIEGIPSSPTQPEMPDENVSASLGLLGYKAGSDDRLDRDGAKNLSDMLRLCYARWEKLEKDFYKPKTNSFDISKIPDISDTAVYDVVHNYELLNLKPHILVDIYRQARQLASIVVPQEYGETALDKLRIGALTCSKLLHRIRSELIWSASESSDQKQDRMSTSTELHHDMEEDEASQLTPVHDDQPDDQDTHRLDRRAASAMGVKSLHRHVRTRVFFSSESHLHAVLNVLRFAHLVDPTLPVPAPEGLEAADNNDELGYLTHVVFRLIEFTSPSGEVSHRLRVSFSNGVNAELNAEGTRAEVPVVEPLSPAHDKSGKGKVHRARQLPPASPLVPLWGPSANLDLVDALRILDSAHHLTQRNVERMDWIGSESADNQPDVDQLLSQLSGHSELSEL